MLNNLRQWNSFRINSIRLPKQVLNSESVCREGIKRKIESVKDLLNTVVSNVQ